LDAPVPAVDLAAADATVRALLPEAAAIALRYFRTDVAADDKGGAGRYDPVTAADRGIEELLRAGLSARFPDHQIVGEEAGTTGPPDAPARWLIDPIDGTKAFVTGVPGWGILIGLIVNGEAVAGWAHQPYLRETFSAIDGAGWFERGEERRPLRTSATRALDQATLYATHPGMFATDQERAAWRRIAPAVRMQRFGGDCYSYCMLAVGFVDLVIENQLNAYDIVALIPIIEAAGGVITNRDGRSPVDGGFVIAAATPELHEAALALINQEVPT
jgi:histidinol phosphatase-like enzyme (inositol monophosphatase family)